MYQRKVVNPKLFPWICCGILQWCSVVSEGQSAEGHSGVVGQSVLTATPYICVEFDEGC